MDDFKQSIIDTVVAIQMPMVVIVTLLGMGLGLYEAGFIGLIVRGLIFFLIAAIGAFSVYILHQISERLGMLIRLQTPRAEPMVTAPPPGKTDDPLHWSAR